MENVDVTKLLGQQIVSELNWKRLIENYVISIW